MWHSLNNRPRLSDHRLTHHPLTHRHWTLHQNPPLQSSSSDDSSIISSRSPPEKRMSLHPIIKCFPRSLSKGSSCERVFNLRYRNGDFDTVTDQFHLRSNLSIFSLTTPIQICVSLMIIDVSSYRKRNYPIRFPSEYPRRNRGEIDEIHLLRIGGKTRRSPKSRQSSRRRVDDDGPRRE